MQDYPYPMTDGVRSIAVGIIFTPSDLKMGFTALYCTQYKQMATLNGWLERTDYHFGIWLLLICIITCGLFAFVLRIQNGERN